MKSTQHSDKPLGKISYVFSLFGEKCVKHCFKLLDQRGAIEFNHHARAVIADVSRVEQKDHLEAFGVKYRAIGNLVVKIASRRTGKFGAVKCVITDGHRARHSLRPVGCWLGTGSDDRRVRCGGEHQVGFAQVGGWGIKNGVNESQREQRCAFEHGRRFDKDRREFIGITERDQVLLVGKAKILRRLPGRVDDDPQRKGLPPPVMQL